ncbi:unnamed protein product [Orchesella dallaii]|uniref:Carrier domain-containing protein n=1 Tax=Orchesella dallaii TaxID=48710 RepID=A0ABP1RYL1_9HEXA
MSAIVGPPGQCNHTAANAFKDAFAHYRSSIGLPATTINWGPWSEVGAATEVEVPGVKAISNLQGLAALEFALKTHRTQTAVFGVSSFVLFRRMWPHHSFRKYLDEKLWNKTGPTLVNSGIEEAPVFWEEFDASSNKAEVMKTHVRNTFRNILKLDQNDVFADDVDIKVLGMDSLMFIEIKNRLQTLFGDRLSITASSIRDSKTVELLSTTLVGLIEGKFSVENRKPTFEEMKALIREDSQLPEHIQAQSQKVGSVNEIKNVFLTGCTGTFGPYVLMNLTNLPQISQVICLMRHSKREAGEERLHKVLSKLELLSKVDMGKVRCVSGNVAEPNLGMEPSDWEELSRSVDAIFHCAASVQHVEYYRNTESKSDMRAVNIGGTKNVLEFACKNKLKHVYHASSLLAVATLDENGRVSEKWPEVGDFDEGTMFGYPVTKFVGDVLMKQAVERGIPCKVFRLPLMAGESRIGRCSIENNHFLLRYIFIMKTGIMSSAPFVVPTLPVDICADVSLQIFFNDDAGPDVYNITPGFPDTDQKFVEVAKEFGYNVDLVEFSEFAKRVMGSGEEASALEAFKEFYNDEDESLKATARSPVFGGGNEESEDGLRNKWWSEKVAKLVPNFFENQKQSIDYIHQDLLFCKSQGWFKRFGL